MTAATDTMPALPEPNAKLLALADRIDHERLWARAGLERTDWSQEQRDRCDAGVELRRYAQLLGQDCWRIFPPRPGFCFTAGTLEAVVAMARRDEGRRSGAQRVDRMSEEQIDDLWNKALRTGKGPMATYLAAREFAVLLAAACGVKLDGEAS